MTVFLRIFFLLFSAASFSLGIASLPSFWPSAEITQTLVPKHSAEVANLGTDPVIAPEQEAASAAIETNSAVLEQGIPPQQSVPEPAKLALAQQAESPVEDGDGFIYPDHDNDVPARSIHLVTPPVASHDDPVCAEMCLILIAANDLEWVRITTIDGKAHLIEASRERCDLPLCLSEVADKGEPADRTLEFAPMPQDGPGWAMLEPDVALRIYDRHGPYNANPVIMTGDPEGALSRRLSAAGLTYLD